MKRVRQVSSEVGKFSSVIFKPNSSELCFQPKSTSRHMGIVQTLFPMHVRSETLCQVVERQCIHCKVINI